MAIDKIISVIEIGLTRFLISSSKFMMLPSLTCFLALSFGFGDVDEFVDLPNSFGDVVEIVDLPKLLCSRPTSHICSSLYYVLGLPNAAFKNPLFKGKHGISRFSRKVFPYVHKVYDRAGS